MDSAQYSNVVISLRGRGTVAENIEAQGVPVHILGMQPNIPSPGALLRLRRIFKETQPAAVLGWMYHGMLMSTLGSLTGKIPVLWNVRQTLYDIRKEKLGSALTIRACRQLSRHPAGIIYNSQTSRSQHEAFGFNAAKSTVIPNGFDTSVFRPMQEARVTVRQSLGLPSDAVLIGLYGRFHPQKDHGTFIHAAGMLAKEQPQAYFLMAGSGITPQNTVLTGMVAAAGITDRTILLGDRRDMPELTAALDIAVSASSHIEAFPNVIGEAMSSGVPCVATDIGDNSWIIGDAGRIVPFGAPIDLARAMHDLLVAGGDARRRLGAQGRRRVIDLFALENITAHYQDVFRSIIRTPREVRC